MRSRFPGSRRRWAAYGVVALVVVVVALEAGIRLTIGHHVAGSVRDQLGARRVSIEVGHTPMVLDLARDRIAVVRARVQDADLCQLTGVDIAATLRDVRMRGQRRVASTDATVEVPAHGLQDLVSSTLGGLGGSIEVRPDPGAGALDVTAGPGGLVRATVVPRLEGDTVRAEVTSASVAGFSLPGATVDRLVGAWTTRSLGQLPLGLRATGLTVTDDGLRLRLHGGSSPIGQARVACPT